MVALILRWSDGLTDVAVIYYGATERLRGFPRYYLRLLVDAQGIEPWTSPV
jgi:hypothetical protein